MRLLEAPVHFGLAAAIGGSRFGGRRRFGEGFEAGLSEVDDMIVLDRACGGDDGGAGAVAATEIAIDGRPVEGPDALPRAQNRPADRLVGPGGRGDKIEHEVVRRVFDRPDLLDDDVLLAFELLGGEHAVGQKVADDVKRELCVLPITRAK